MGVLDTLIIDQARLKAETRRFDTAMLTAMRGAIVETTKGLERALEEATRAHVKGRLWRAWTSGIGPKTALAREPVGFVRLNGKRNKGAGVSRTYGAMEFFTQAGRITGGAGQYLAIPLPAAGRQPRDRMLSPGDFERRTGAKLRFVYRPGKNSLLVLDDALGGSGASRAKLIGKRLRGKNVGQTVPIFVLVPAVQFANRFSIRPIILKAENDLLSNFTSRARAIR